MIDLWTLADGRSVEGPTEPVDAAFESVPRDQSRPTVRIWFASKAAALAFLGQVDSVIRVIEAAEQEKE